MEDRENWRGERYANSRLIAMMTVDLSPKLPFVPMFGVWDNVMIELKEKVEEPRLFHKFCHCCIGPDACVGPKEWVWVTQDMYRYLAVHGLLKRSGVKHLPPTSR